MFFNVTRPFAIGWFNQSLLYALIPLFVYVIAAFLIAAMQPELTKIDEISGNRELKLSDLAAFIMLCIAGSFVLFQVQSLAQGIAGGLAIPVGARSRNLTATGVVWGRAGLGHTAAQSQAAIQRVQSRLRPAQSSTGLAMQRSILRNANAA
jgi:type IV secretion system protein VirB6